MRRCRPNAMQHFAGMRSRTAMWAAMAALTGCQSAPTQTPSLPRAVVPEGTGATQGAAQSDEIYNWRGLLIAPFGTVLKDMPLALHEVLLFRDDAHTTGPEDAPPGTAPPGTAECYAADTPAPPFAGRTPVEWVLCFTRDRLSRIQASIRLPTGEGRDVFAAACAAWLKSAVPAAAGTMPATGVPATETQTAEASAAACEGRDGIIRFSGRLSEDTDRPDMLPTESTMSITLDSVSAP